MLSLPSPLWAFPPDHAVLQIEEITHVCYVPDTQQAVIWFTSTRGQKVALVSPLADLNRAVLQLQSDPMQTRLRAINGGK